MEHVLVIDDNVDIAHMLAERWLPTLGFAAKIAGNSAHGQAVLARESIDLILLDLYLPDATDLSLLVMLRRDHPDIPIILMTAHGSERLAVEAFQLGVRNYLIKPFTIDHLGQVINDALRERRLQQEKQQLAEGLRQRVQELTVLNTIGRSITMVTELDMLLTRIVEAAIQLTGAEEGFLLLRDRGDELVVRAAKTVGDARAQVLRLPVQDSIAGQVMETRRPVRIGRHAGEHPVKLKTGYLVRTLLLVPLLARRQALGVLGVDNVTNPEPFTEAQERLLTSLADYAAIALENARLLRAVQRSETRYRDLFTHAHDLFVVLDQDLRMVEVNAAGPRMLGYPAPEFVGRPLERLTPTDTWPLIEQRLRHVLADEAELAPFEMDLRQRDGTLLRVELSARAIIDAEGRRHLLCTARDLTERLLLQAQTLHAQKVAALEQVVAGVAHELNNPLTGIMGYSQLLLRTPQLDADVRQDVERILYQAQRAGQIVQGMISFGRESQLSRTSVNVSTLIESTLELHAGQFRAASIAIQCDLSPYVPTVLGDPFQLQHVVTHLLRNAHSAMQAGGGTLTVRAHAVNDLAQLETERPSSPRPLHMRGPAVVIEVSDTGIGIAPEQLGNIFDPFWTTRAVGEGAGLGLSACSGIVAQHEGAIWASSTINEGTTFYIALPPKSALPKRPPAQPDAQCVA